jgi:DNA-binding NtrC family response regulator
MLENLDVDRTLPSIIASVPGKFQAQELVLTIVFHPDTVRIGQRAVVPKHSGNANWILGRRSPIFSSVDEQGASPLEDRHISRQALKLIYHDKELLISRFETASRCRVGNAELHDSVELDLQQLRKGVPLLLGHSIVLLLRLGLRTKTGSDQVPCTQILRGSSACMGRIREQIAQVAASDLDVLILGETGTGKELAATAIHRASARASAPLVSVNMAAVPRDLAPAALFGSARGAFTGADKAASGYFEQAEGGTLFLDEIGDTSPDVQPQLLRALQQREIQAVGGAIRRVDLRVISATDAALDDEAVAFKAALRHRLGASEIVLPPLRDHPEDVGELLLHFLQGSAEVAGRVELLPHAQSPALDIAAWASLFFRLVGYRWPGNVRELANVAQQIVLSSENTLTLSDSIQAMLTRRATPTPADYAVSSRARMQDISEEIFERSMASNGFEPLSVSRHLGVSRAAVYRRIEASARYRLVSEILLEELQRALVTHKGDSTAAARQLRVSVNSLRSRLRKLSVDWH